MQQFFKDEAEDGNMIKSMTGFGAGAYNGKDYKIYVEIKSVNHRYSSIEIHLPGALRPLEESLRRQAAARLARGKADVFISLAEHVPRNKKIKVDKDLVIAYYGALKEISSLIGVPLTMQAGQVAQYQEVLSVEEEELDAGLFREGAAAALDMALERLQEMRLAEGAHIYEDLAARAQLLEKYADEIEQRSPQVAAEYRGRLTEKLKEILGGAVDEARLLQETLFFADKADVTEEIVRLRSHVKQFNSAMAEDGAAVGRKLDFIVQEMNREANTIASKANDAQIAGLMVEIKSEIEKIREQVQNIE